MTKYDKETIAAVLDEIDKKIQSWETILKEKNYKKGSIKYVRIRVIITDFESLKEKIKAMGEKA